MRKKIEPFVDDQEMETRQEKAYERKGRPA